MGNDLRIVEVEWVDSNVAYGWLSTERAKKNADSRPLTCRSVGYVLSEDAEDRLTLIMSQADNLDGEGSSIAEVMSIPNISIIKVRDLK